MRQRGGGPLESVWQQGIVLDLNPHFLAIRGNYKAKKGCCPTQSFQTRPRDFWFFVYSAVDDFVDGQILKVQHVLQPTIQF